MASPTVELGLGGSFFGAVRSEPMYRFWQMRRRTEVGAFDSIACEFPSRFASDVGASIGTSPPTPSVRRETTYQFWLGETLDHNGGLDAANYNLAGTIPDGCRAFKLDGVNDYFRTGILGQSWPGTAAATVELVLTIDALPAGAVEPALFGVDAKFGITLKSDGKVYVYYDGSSVLSQNVSTGVLTHIVVTRSGASPTDTLTLSVNNVTTSHTPTRADIGGIRPYYGKHWTNAHYASVTYQVIAHYPVVLNSTRIAAHYNALQWTDVTDDTKGPVPLVIERGIRDDSPASRVASTGTCTFALNNLNTGGVRGYYSPGNANCRAGFGKGIPVRVKQDGDTVFLGRVRRIAPTPGKGDGNLSTVMATDYFDAAATALLDSVAILEDVRGDQVFNAVVGYMPVQPNGVISFSGSETYALALDNTRDESVSVLQELARLAVSELGYIYQLRDGRLVYEARGTRVFNEPTATVTLNDTMHGLDVAEVSSTSLNRVQITAHPRVVDAAATTVLFAITNALQIGPGETKTIIGPFRTPSAPGLTTRVGGLEMVTPVATTDYTMNSKADGAGVDLTASLGITTNFGANGVQFVLVNNSPETAHITKLQCRGKGVYDFRTVVVRAQNDAAVAADGVNALNLDMVYQEDPNVAQALAESLLNGYGDLSGTRARRVDLFPDDPGLPSNLHQKDISDRVAVSETVTGATGEYYINGVRLEYRAGALTRLSWWLTPAEPVSYWTLGLAGASELGDTTLLGAA